MSPCTFFLLSSLSFSLEAKEKTPWHPQGTVRRQQRRLDVHGDEGQITTGPVLTLTSASASPSHSSLSPTLAAQQIEWHAVNKIS